MGQKPPRYTRNLGVIEFSKVYARLLRVNRLVVQLGSTDSTVTIRQVETYFSNYDLEGSSIQAVEKLIAQAKACDYQIVMHGIYNW